jgi:hypothetical protein
MDERFASGHQRERETERERERERERKERESCRKRMAKKNSMTPMIQVLLLPGVLLLADFSFRKSYLLDVLWQILLKIYLERTQLLLHFTPFQKEELVFFPISRISVIGSFLPSRFLPHKMVF